MPKDFCRRSGFRIFCWSRFLIKRSRDLLILNAIYHAKPLRGEICGLRDVMSTLEEQLKLLLWHISVVNASWRADYLCFYVTIVMGLFIEQRPLDYPMACTDLKNLPFALVVQLSSPLSRSLQLITLLEETWTKWSQPSLIRLVRFCHIDHSVRLLTSALHYFRSSVYRRHGCSCVG